MELAQALEEELLKRQTYQEIVEELEAQTEDLEAHYASQRRLYSDVLNENELLFHEIEKLKAKSASFKKYRKRAEGNQSAAEMRNRNLKQSLTSLDQEAKKAQGFHEKAEIFYEEQGLRQRIERLAGSEIKSGSALYTALEAIIKSVEENEFEGVQLRTLLDKNKSKLGARLHFTNVSSQYADVIAHLSPVIGEMGKRFRNYGLKVETRTKKTSTGTVTALDVRVFVHTSRELLKSPNL